MKKINKIKQIFCRHKDKEIKYSYEDFYKTNFLDKDVTRCTRNKNIVCKKCGKILASHGVVTYIDKIEDDINDIIKKEETKEIKKVEERIRIKEYQGWSLNNLNNDIGSFIIGEDKIALFSNHEVNETEMYGIKSLLLKVANIYEGSDFNIKITKGYYDSDEDKIYPKRKCFNYFLMDNVLSKCAHQLIYDKENKESLKEFTEVIYIEIKRRKRNDKSWWWKFKNKRYVIVEDMD